MNQKGFSTLTLLILMPLLLVILTILAASYLVMRVDSQSRHLCRLTLLQSQKNVAGHLEELMKLNHKARALRASKAAAESALQIAVEPSAKAAAATALKLIHARQNELAARQNLLILKARSESRAGPRRALANIRKAFVQQSQLVSNSESRFTLQSKSRTGEFDIVAYPSDSLTPDYQPSPNFSERQLMQAQWRFEVPSLLPDWTRHFINASHLQIHAACSVTLEPSHSLTQEASTWVPRMKKDKS